MELFPNLGVLFIQTKFTYRLKLRMIRGECMYAYVFVCVCMRCKFMYNTSYGSPFLRAKANVKLPRSCEELKRSNESLSRTVSTWVRIQLPCLAQYQLLFSTSSSSRVSYIHVFNPGGFVLPLKTCMP